MTPSRTANQSWRRYQNQVHKHKGMGTDPYNFKPEKNWKMVYTRSDKLKRAKQLGFDYPRVHFRELIHQQTCID